MGGVRCAGNSHSVARLRYYRRVAASSPSPRIYRVSAKSKQPLLNFMTEALVAEGCRIIFCGPPNEAPFRITFETPEGERMGIMAYAFLANQVVTNERPEDEHRFQVKYGSRDGREHDLWQDPYGLYTTLFLGINPELGIFVGGDPVLHSPTKMYISIEFKQRHVQEIMKSGWLAWERECKDRRIDAGPVEVLVGGRRESFLSYIRFEREALAEDQGHRQLLAERLGRIPPPVSMQVEERHVFTVPPPARLHDLVREFELSEAEVLDLIGSAPRLKMAVRGWVAEEHLFREVRTLSDVSDCERVTTDRGADIMLRFRGYTLNIECKNVLRKRNSAGFPRVDFQRTRAAKGNPCSRYYSPDEFSVVAACLHAVTESWEFRYIVPGRLDPHKKCPGKLASNVKVDQRWQSDGHHVLTEALANLS